MILPHTFDEEKHLYTTPGHYVMSTSDVLDLNGLYANLDVVPRETLEDASWRGKCLHKAVELYESGQDWQAVLDDEHMPHMEGWFAFRDSFPVRMVGKPETRYVYLPDGGDVAIGGTIDARFIYEGDLWICDLKTIYPVTGKALESKKLAWRLQTESYKTATEMDEEFMRSLSDCQRIRRAIVHIHKDMPKKHHGFQFHVLDTDDVDLWAAAVRVAMAKKVAGYVTNQRSRLPLKNAIRASLEVCGA